METKANYVAVGAFVLASVLGFVVALLWLAGAQYNSEFAYYRTFFSGAVTGLGDGTIVRYNGINVGHVSKLTFDPDDPKRVVVDLQIDPNLKIHSDSVASIASEGLTGGSYVEIDGGTKKTPVLERTMFGDYPVIASKPSTLQQLEQSAPILVAKLNKIADRLADVLNDNNRRALSELLDNVRVATGVLKARSGDIDTTLHNLSIGTTTLNGDLTDLHVTLQGAQGTLTAANGTLGKIGKLADDADTAVNGAQLDELSSQVRDLARSFSRLSDSLDKEPTKLIFGDRRKGYTPQ